MAVGNDGGATHLWREAEADGACLANGKALPHGNNLQTLQRLKEESAATARAEERVDPDSCAPERTWVINRTWHEICVTETGKAYPDQIQSPTASAIP
jgi:hypothetical protein